MPVNEKIPPFLVRGIGRRDVMARGSEVVSRDLLRDEALEVVDEVLARERAVVGTKVLKDRRRVADTAAAVGPQT